MCQTSEHIILNQSENAQVSWCKRCRRYSLQFNSCCLAFDHQGIMDFRTMLDNLEEADYQYQFLGKPHVLIKNQHASMGISLTTEEVALLKDLIQEAVTINEVFGIIYK